MERFIIEVCSHSFHVFVPYANDNHVVFDFCQALTEYEPVWSPKLKRKIMRPKKTFATVDRTKSQFGFIRSEFDSFIRHLRLKGFREQDYKVTYIEAAPGVPISFSLPGISPRESQVSAIDFFGAPGAATRVLPLPTGQGKTLTTLMYLAKLAVRTFIVGQAVHLPTWLKSINEYTDIDKKDILVIQGSASMRSFISSILNGTLHAKVILASSSTINNYLKEFIYGADNTEMYDIPPNELFEKAGIGVSVTDECHEVLHQVFRRTIMFNAPLQIFLSATLDPSTEFTKRLYEAIFPLQDRFTDFKNNDHIDVYSVRYHANDPDKIRCVGSMGYSHNLFEVSVLSNPKRREAYLDLIWRVFEKGYLEFRKEGMKMLIFAYRVETCEIIAAYIKKRLEDNTTVSIFTSKEPESVLSDFEVIVTTPKSCGTGKDIPDLAVSIMTPAISSKQLVQQINGRTRKLVNYPGINPRFYYLSCTGIEKHMQYDNEHLKDFANKSNSVNTINLAHYI